MCIYIYIILYIIYVIYIYMYIRKWKLLCHYHIQGSGSMSLPDAGFRVYVTTLFGVQGLGCGGDLGGLALGKGRKQWTISAQLALRSVQI